jgi:RNA polymerase sigma-70 factor, ECF subfamily
LPEVDVDGAYRRFGEAVQRRARRVLRDDALADDALQETFLRAHRYRHTFKGGSMLSWLFTITDRVCFDALKRRGVVVDSDTAAAALAAVDVASPMAPVRAASALDQMVRDQHVASVLSATQDDVKQILVHRYLDELSTVEIAERMQQSERTIRRRLEDFFARFQTTRGG